MKYALIILITILIGTAFALLMTGPRMYVQQHIRTFQSRVTELPKGVVPVESLSKLPSVEAAAAMTNPLSATPANLERGKIYYGYYCMSCHGAGGPVDGPVGESYTPKPASLKSAKVQAYSDGQLLRAMLTGVGHEPVLERVVPPDHRWYIVLYVRSLAASESSR